MRPVTDLERRVAPFKVVSDYQPSGDQPAAIAEITKRINDGLQDVVLLGATGTGKTATVAWVAEQIQRPMLVLQGADDEVESSRSVGDDLMPGRLEPATHQIPPHGGADLLGDDEAEARVGARLP